MKIYREFDASVKNEDGKTIAYRTNRTARVVCSFDEEYSGAIVIPDTIDVDGLEYIVTAIGTVGASSGIGGLTSISIPESVICIEDGAFGGCDSLTSINVNSNNPNYSSKKGVLFDKYATVLIRCPEGKKGVCHIPGSVTRISDNAFSSCIGITSIKIPCSVTHIEERAFWLCRSLVSINIPSNINHIGNCAFAFCDRLTSINVESDNPNYLSEAGVLYNKNKTTLIRYPQKKKGEVYNIPAGVTAICDRAFQGCGRLTSINIPESVIDIRDNPFQYCDGLASINVESGNPNYLSEEGVLYDKNKTTLIRYPSRKKGAYNIPASITAINNYAFCNCSGLTSLTIPRSLTHLEHDIFNSFYGLTSINVDGNHPEYSSQDGVLYDKDKTWIIKFPQGKTGACIIPNSITRIRCEEFWWCKNLTSITIPQSVIYIGEAAFRYCSGLTEIHNKSVVPQEIDTTVFEDVNQQTCILYVPESAVTVYKSAPVWKAFANIVGEKI